MSVIKIVWHCYWQQAYVIYNLYLAQKLCVCHKQSVSVTDSLYLSQTVCVCHRKYVSVTYNLCLSQTCLRQSVPVTDSLCPTDTVVVCQTSSLSVRECMCQSQTVYVCPRVSVFLPTVFLFFSQIVRDGCRKYLSVSMCICQTLFLLCLGLILIFLNIFLHQDLSVQLNLSKNKTINFLEPWGNIWRVQIKKKKKSSNIYLKQGNRVIL